MSLPLTVGVDPGKEGYSCLLGANEATRFHNLSDPYFWAAAVFDKNSAVCEDCIGEYDLVLMVAQTRTWFTVGVRLVVLEQQAPQGHGTRIERKLGAGREGVNQAFALGRGFGLWEMALTAAGFRRFGPTEEAGAREAVAGGCASYLIVPPLVWKLRMGCIATHKGPDDHHARRMATNEKTISVAKQIDPTTDFRAIERTPGARTLSPDKSASRLLAEYGLRRVLGVPR